MKFQIRSHTFYVLGEDSFKLISHWADFYLDNIAREEVDWNKRYCFSLGKKNTTLFLQFHSQLLFADEKIMLMFSLYLANRGIYASFSKWYQNNSYLQVRMGSFFRAIDGDPFHIEFLCFIWSANYIATALLPCLFRLRHFRWIEIVLWIQNKIHHRKISKSRLFFPTQNSRFSLFSDLTTKEASILHRRVHLILSMTCNSIRAITIPVLMSLVLFFYQQLEIKEFLLIAIPWIMWYIYMTLTITSMIYMINAYLIVVSMTLRIKFRRFEKMIRFLSIRKGLITKYCLYRKFRYVNSVMLECHNYNQWWRHTFTVAIMWRLLIINFTAFVVCFYNFHPIVRLAYSMIFLNESCAFLFLILQVTNIERETERTGQLLRRLTHFRPFQPISLKVKVNLVQHLELKL